MPNKQIQSLTVAGETYDIVDNTSGYALLASPAFTGTPTAPTPTSGDDSTKIATTAFVQDAMSAAGAGTVTSVGVSNATNGGLSVSGSPITSSGTISIGHSNVLTSAQTTQAVYPIKIDKNGHISAYGSAVTIPDDTKVTQTPLNATNAYREVIVTASSISSETTSTVGFAKNLTYNDYTPTLKLTKNSDDTKSIQITGDKISVNNGQYTTNLAFVAPTSSRSITFPNATGTVALTSDIPTVPTTASSHTTGISIGNHSTTSIYGVSSSTTTASKASGANSTVPSLTFAMDSTTTTQLNITWSAGSASSWSFSDVTVPIKNSSSTTVVTSATHSITDNGHTHSLT